MKPVTEMMRSGFLWTAAGKELAKSRNAGVTEVYTGMADNQT
jgi:type 1 glutamine amidotransferase